VVAVSLQAAGGNTLLYHDGATEVNGPAMKKRRTLARAVPLEGIGLHSGAPVRLRLVPAEAETGIVFVRTDAGHARIPALLENAGPSFYATVLQKDGLSVSTIEHLMAALYALQVDDLAVELDAAEVPILDGSSLPFVTAIRAAGFHEHDALRHYIHIVKPITITHEEKSISIRPCGEYRVTYAIDFDHPALGYQELTASLWRGDQFAEKLAPARTFTFEREVEVLRERGLALGGSLDNAVVVGDRGILNADLRYPDEFVRHKMLDLTGDLSLLGHPLLGHVVAYRAGHDLHARLARRIADSPESWYLAPWHEELPAEADTPPAGAAP
jgi:UDP-3-O-[3-hydroxymyristoyl] N-acetylglucosamine deacetylase